MKNVKITEAVIGNDGQELTITFVDGKNPQYHYTTTLPSDRWDKLYWWDFAYDGFHDHLRRALTIMEDRELEYEKEK